MKLKTHHLEYIDMYIINYDKTRLCFEVTLVCQIPNVSNVVHVFPAFFCLSLPKTLLFMK